MNARGARFAKSGIAGRRRVRRRAFQRGAQGRCRGQRQVDAKAAALRSPRCRRTGLGMGGGPCTSMASLFATHTFASGTEPRRAHRRAQEDPARPISHSPEQRAARRRPRGARVERNEKTRREPLEEPSAPVQAPSRTGRRASHLGGLALCVSTFASAREATRRSRRHARASAPGFPQSAGKSAGARCVSSTPETTSTAAHDRAGAERLVEQQRREAEPEDRDEQRERRDGAGRVRAQQEGPQAPADRRGREGDVGDRGDAAEVDPGQRVADLLRALERERERQQRQRRDDADPGHEAQRVRRAPRA